MKKNYIYLVATFLMAGCAQDAFQESNLQETDVPQEIKLSAGTSGVEVTSRGIGSVGSLDSDASNNVWNGHELSIFCINKIANDLTKNDKEQVYLRETKATAANKPNENKSAITFNEPKYYPLQGAFNFFGYYIDKDGANGTPEATASDIKQKVTIDGTQDIMIADATLSVTDKVNLVKKLIENGKLTGGNLDYFIDETTAEINDANSKTTIENEWTKAYSSYTARRNIQPNLIFKHQLARLKFQVLAGDDNAIGGSTVDINSTTYKTGILIESIELVNARTQGVITITKDKIEFTHDNTETKNNEGKYIGSFTLKQKPQNTAEALPTLIDLEEIAPISTTDYKEIGESILAFPEDKYTININTLQYVKKDANTGNGYALMKTNGSAEATSYTNVTLSLPLENNQIVPFEAGKSYDIKIKVYSNQEISISATLTGWEAGGEVIVSPGDEMFD